ncbi:MAG: amino acid permease [Chitinophagaceae bacterium]|nr:amino acid permease [Chitinophagaceae bacterium]
MIVMGLVIGLGIFRTSKDVAGAALTPEIFFAAWVAGGILSVCGGLTFAEIGSRYPVTGGYYSLFSYAYHPSVAFAINCVILVSNAASLTGVALIGSEYIMEVVSPGHGSSPLIAALAILLFYAVNLAGLQYSSRTQNILMIIKISVLLIIIAGIFFVPALDTGRDEGRISPDSIGGKIGMIISFGLALKATCFSYGGYQQTINFGGDVHDPTKTVPRSIMLGMGMVIILYLLVNVAYNHIIGFDELKTSNAIASVVAGKLFGREGEIVSAIVMFVAVLAYVNVSLLSNPRVMVAMSRDNILPQSFSVKHEPTGVFKVSLTVFAALCVIILFFADSFNKILSFSIFLDSIGMVTAGIALFIFRKRKLQTSGSSYTIRWYPLIPIIFIAGYIFVATVIALQEPAYAIIGTSTLIFFLLLYTFIYGKKRKKP